MDVDTHEEESQSADDTEDEDDTRLPACPILALDKFVQCVLTASEEGGVDCGHFALLGSKDSARRGWLVGWSGAEGMEGEVMYEIQGGDGKRMEAC